MVRTNQSNARRAVAASICTLAIAATVAISSAPTAHAMLPADGGSAHLSIPASDRRYVEAQWKLQHYQEAIARMTALAKTLDTTLKAIRQNIIG